MRLLSPVQRIIRGSAKGVTRLILGCFLTLLSSLLLAFCSLFDPQGRMCTVESSDPFMSLFDNLFVTCYKCPREAHTRLCGEPQCNSSVSCS